MRLRHFISTEDSPLTPAGMILSQLEGMGEGWLPADGRELQVAEYPSLYGVIGDAYNPAEIPAPPTVLDRIVTFFGIRRKPRLVPNPSYKPGYFTLPRLP